MNRRDFIKKGCIACSSVTLLSAVLQSCTTVKYVSGELNDHGMLIPITDFADNREYLIARHDDLLYPICIYKDGDAYSALLMRCTHQGAELQVAGDLLICPAHGSEFDKWGKVAQGPAADGLRSFPVAVKDNHLFIDLRKQS